MSWATTIFRLGECPYKTCHRMAHNDHTSQLLYVNIRGVVDVTAGDNFLGLRDKKSVYQHGSYSQRLWCLGVLTPLLWTACHFLVVSIIHYMTCDSCTERWLTQAHLWFISSISRVLFTTGGKASLWLRVEFSETCFKHRSVWTKGSFFHEIEFRHWIYQVMCLICNNYVWFWVASGHNSKTVQNRTYFLLTFLSQRPRKLSPTVLSTAHKALYLYMYRNILTL